MPRSRTDVTGSTITLSTDSADACRLCWRRLVAHLHMTPVFDELTPVIRLHPTGNVSQALRDRRRKHADVGGTAWAADLSVIGIQMWCRAICPSIRWGRKCTKWTAAASERIPVHTAQQTGDDVTGEHRDDTASDRRDTTGTNDARYRRRRRSALRR